MSAISPCLWFDDDLEEAIGFYTSVFPDSRIGPVSRRYDDGSVLAAEWEINGGPAHAGSTETVSLAVDCADQAEVAHYWRALTADGGEESVCGWLKDRFGLSWQIVPTRLYELLSDPDPERARAVLDRMMQM